MSNLRLGVLASGRGSNFQAIIDEIESKRLNAEIVLLITDNPSAFAIERAKKHGIEYLVMRPKEYSSKDDYFIKIAEELKKRDVGLVVLAGFMRIVRKPLIDAFPNRIMNIHPALLPAFPGLHGQRQALEYGVKISGCTVHFVDEGMDTGPIIIQAAVPMFQDDTEDTLSERILRFEHKIYPEAIRLFSEGRIEVEGRMVSIKGYTLFDTIIVNPPA
ncbi:MAG: phosphoribosylglycinamide formyltransferase [Nitrospirae bacterium]|nr:phosphoribosylglycinamide formyltransferase [Nitrospirota bacterium]